MLDAISGTRYPAALTAAGEAVSCGLGVLKGPLFGLFDIVTAPERRNEGHATALLSSMLAWAREHGARHAYLAVVARNAPARRLYDKLGFREAYEYWYRVPGGR